jgi:hypothetical protein
MCIHYLIKTAIPVIILVAFAMAVFLYLGSGPLWNILGTSIIESCD